MTKARMFALLIVAGHWIVAIVHLFFAAEVLPAPNNSVSWLAITLITSGHVVVSILLSKLSDKVAGLVSVIFFLAALSADLYEHFLHASQNNVFMVAHGDWTALFNGSVFILLTLEIVGCLLGTMMLGGWTRNNKSAPGLNSKSSKQSCKPFSSQFGYVADDISDVVLAPFTRTGRGNPFRQRLAGFLCRHQSASLGIPDALINGSERFRVFLINGGNGILQGELLCLGHSVIVGGIGGRCSGIRLPVFPRSHFLQRRREAGHAIIIA